jgi:hypothetical protein
MVAPTFTIEPYCDELEPKKAIHVYEPQSGLRAIVVDNTACGPAIGGVRLAADVSLEEVLRLARAMTLKNAAARNRSSLAAPPSNWPKSGCEWRWVSARRVEACLTMTTALLQEHENSEKMARP